MEEKISVYRPDSIDLAILDLLQSNGKSTIKELSAVLNLSNTPVYERIKRLEKEGFILQYAAILDKHLLGKSFMVFCHISLKEHTQSFITKFEEEIIHLDEVVECYHLTGKSDYLLKVLVGNMQQYQKFVVDKLAKLENLGTVESVMVMKEIKHSNKIQLSLK